MFARYILPFVALFGALALGSFLAAGSGYGAHRDTCTVPPRAVAALAAKGYEAWSEYTPRTKRCEWLVRPTRAVAVRECKRNAAYTIALRAQCLADYMSAGLDPVEGR